MTVSIAVSCTIPVDELRVAPFDLIWGSQIMAKVIAINSYGNSSESEIGSGAIIIIKPDAPFNLTEDETLRTE
jgi:hypothetical protein